MLIEADKKIIARDQALPGLEALLDSAVLLAELQQLPQLKSAVAVEVQYLRYKPERRLVARLGRNNQTIAVIRCASPEKFTKMLLGNTFGVAQGSVHLLGADGSSCTLATHWQKGHSLCPEEGTLPSVELAKKLAKQVARIHSASYKHLTTYRIADEINALKGVWNIFKYLLPEHENWFVQVM